MSQTPTQAPPAPARPLPAPGRPEGPAPRGRRVGDIGPIILPAGDRVPAGDRAPAEDGATAEDRAAAGGRGSAAHPSRRGKPAGRSRLAHRLATTPVPELAVGLIALAFFSWNLHAPSPTRDEAATVDIGRRSVSQILALATHVDLVHVAYYLLVKPLTAVGDGVTASRALSVAAMAATAVVLVRIGRRLSSLTVGVTAGLLLVAIPLASRYAQEARSYALVTLVATVATHALLGALRSGGRRRWCWYGVAVGVTAVFNVIALLLLVPHALYVALTAAPARRRAWAAAAGATVVALAPFVVAALGQRSQLDWLWSPGLADLTGFAREQYGSLALPAAGAAAGVLLLAVHRRWPLARRFERLRRLTCRPHAHALALGLFWSVVPPVLLWSVALVRPLFTFRYLVFTLPGSALLLASLSTVAVRLTLPALRRGGGRALRVAVPVGAVLPLLLAVLGGWESQERHRDPALGHGEDVRGAAAYVAAHARRGDAVLFVPGYWRLVQQVYPERFAKTRDLALAGDPASTATIAGVEREPAELRAALRDAPRVWVVGGWEGLAETWNATDREKTARLLQDYRVRDGYQTMRFQVLLFVRPATSPARVQVTPPPPIHPAVPF